MKSMASSVGIGVEIFVKACFAEGGGLFPSESVGMYKNIVAPRNKRHMEIAKPLGIGGKEWPFSNPEEAPATKVSTKRKTSDTRRSPACIICMIRAGIKRLGYRTYYSCCAYCDNTE